MRDLLLDRVDGGPVAADQDVQDVQQQVPRRVPVQVVHDLARLDMPALPAGVLGHLFIEIAFAILFILDSIRHWVTGGDCGRAWLDSRVRLSFRLFLIPSSLFSFANVAL